MNAYGFAKKIKLHQNYSFHRKVSLNSVFYNNGISFPSGMLQGLNFGQKLCFFTIKNIEIRKSLIAYRSPPCANKCFCLYMCSHILHNI